jgi:hypothetical protein
VKVAAQIKSISEYCSKNNDMMDVDDDSRECEQNEDRVVLKMNNRAWAAVQTAVNNSISFERETNAKEMQPPTESSSKIARYNTKSHYRFESEVANLTVDGILGSLLSCNIRSRPLNYDKDHPKYGRVPLEIPTFQPGRTLGLIWMEI